MADIKKASEDADRMIAELAQQRAAASAEHAITEPPASPDLAPDPADVVANDPPVVSANTEIVPSVNADALTSLRKDVDDANQRWKSLQGMINKKDTELDNMRALLAQVSQKTDPVSDPVPTSYTDADWERGIGDLEARPLFDSRIEQIMAPKINALISRIVELEKSLKGVSDVTARTSAEVFDDALARQVPDWKSVNIDPAFIAWLDEEDGFTGYKKLDLLKDAYSRSDLTRTVKFFTTFKEFTGKPTPVVPAEPKKDNVTKLISPGKSKSSSTPSTPSDADTSQIWTKSDISRLYDDERNGRISRADFDKYERDLFKAQRENRIAA